jgi:hypothetical protein
MLRLTAPGNRWSVWLFWEPGSYEIDRWYINLEVPQQRTRLGFDYLDQLLDVVMRPDRTSWEWKDEDEIREAVALNLMTSAEADALRLVGLDAVSTLQSQQPPFQSTWAGWRPDPSWAVPELPRGWDQPV